VGRARGAAVKVFLTGAAGFIGSNLADRLLAQGHTVVGYDNFSTGQREFLELASLSPRFNLQQGDILDLHCLTSAMAGCDLTVHFAANADVRFGPDHPRKDLDQNTIGTANVLEAARRNGVPRFVFSSTGSVYGEPSVFPTPEDAPFPIQTSLYGASKLAAEGLIGAYAEAYGIQVFIYRFVSILGERYTHGHVLDFYRQLREHPERLHVLGNGHQRKSYLYVQDCIDAILLTLENAADKVNVFNLGLDEHCEVLDSIRWISEHLGVRPEMTFAGGERGWVGDNPFIFLDCSRVRRFGWKPKLGIQGAVVRTLEYLQRNQWVLDRR
jgi:UDP-glucose 4-epimerase